MTDAAATEAPVEQHRRRRRPWLLFVAPIVAAAAVTSTALVRSAVRDEGYGPLVAGEAFGTAGPGLASFVDDRPRLRPSAGPAYILSLLDNDGTHEVRVSGIMLDSTVRAARWAPADNGSEMLFRPARWRAFPATVPAEHTTPVDGSLDVGDGVQLC